MIDAPDFEQIATMPETCRREVYSPAKKTISPTGASQEKSPSKPKPLQVRLQSS